jgi:hypothetical protein
MEGTYHQAREQICPVFTMKDTPRYVYQLEKFQIVELCNFKGSA